MSKKHLRTQTNSFTQFFFATPFTRFHIRVTRYFHDRWQFSIHSRPFTRLNFTVIIKLFLFSIQHEFVSFCTINIPKWPKEHFFVEYWEWFSFWFMGYQFSFASSDVTHVPNGGSYSIVRISFCFHYSQKIDFAWHEQSTAIKPNF